MNLEPQLSAAPYVGYAYGYPHKTAYRTLEPPVRLSEAWAEEPKHALTLYVHIPTCEMRCGFCNLFTTTAVGSSFGSAYLDALERQAARVAHAIQGACFEAAAIGGGTPTQLSAACLRRLFRLLEDCGARARDIPTTVETSPRTADEERLEVLCEAGVRRLSIGVQSFHEPETRALGRPQKADWVETALSRIRTYPFPVLNIDLMYGIACQTPQTFVASIERALNFAPEELYLYPLYVRPLTGLGIRSAVPTDSRLACYRAGRELLLSRGYEQVSMRFFRLPSTASSLQISCQEDATVGLGCGARSYTRGLHYSSEWAVERQSIGRILEAYLSATDEVFDRAWHGIWLSRAEQRRRYVLKTLLRLPGVPLADYTAFFGSDARADLPELRRLLDVGLCTVERDRLRLTSQGLELSDAIGPYLYSQAVRRQMAEHTPS